MDPRRLARIAPWNLASALILWTSAILGASAPAAALYLTVGNGDVEDFTFTVS